MTDDHIFIDAAGTIFQGKQAVLQAWKGFFTQFPDYKNEFEHFKTQNSIVTVTGHSVCSDKRLDGPALWKVNLRDNKISEWRVYEDTPGNRKTLEIG